MKNREDDIKLLRELFIDIDYEMVTNDRDMNNSIIKSRLKYIKSATKYIPLTKLYRLYKNITSVYKERQKDKHLEEIEYNMIMYFIYLLNTNIISEDKKEELVLNILFLYERNLSNLEVITKENDGKLRVYSYTEKSSRHIYDVREKIRALEKVNYSSKSMLNVLLENIGTIMKGFNNILDDDVKNLGMTRSKKRIK